MQRRLSLLAAILVAGPAWACAPDGDAGLRVISLTNAYRASLGRAPLAGDAELARAATIHACDLAASGRFSHQGSDGSNVGDRARTAGYAWAFIAENIAKGQPSAASVLSSWRSSSGHNDNLLDPAAREIGVASVPSPDGTLWVMVLGAAR
ncbi:MAG: CAP domain-containing protein [Pseudomonadota bacterium]